MLKSWLCCAEECGEAKESGNTLLVNAVSAAKAIRADEVMPLDPPFVDLSNRPGHDTGDDQSTKVGLRLERQCKRDTWGFDLEVTPARDVLIVAQLHESRDGSASPVQAYNASAPAERRIAAGDCLIRINGRADAGSMTRLLQEELEVRLETRRPVTHTSSVQKRGKSLGLSLRHLDSGCSVFIGSVEPAGAVGASGADIVAGDRIVAVNGITGACEMVAELQASDEPSITIARLP